MDNSKNVKKIIEKSFIENLKKYSKTIIWKT